jgi:Uma2 family endonuclease
MVRKIQYRAVSFEQAKPDALANALSGARKLVVAIDVAKTKMMAGFAREDGAVVRLVKWTSPAQMATAATTHFVTEAEFLALPESNQRIELIDGEVIVPPNPTFEHQTAVGRLFNALSGWAAKQVPQPTVALAPLDVHFGPNRILQPDLMVFLRPLPRDIETPITRVPELVIEVLSNNRSYDWFTKRALYAEAGVEEYWLVDIDGSRIEVRTGAALSGERFCTDKLSSLLLPDFVLDVSALIG